MMIHQGETGSFTRFTRTDSLFSSGVHLSLCAVCTLLLAPSLFAQLDPLTTKSDASPKESRKCTIIFKLFSNFESECSRTVQNPLDSQSLQSGFQNLKLNDENESKKTIVQIPSQLSDTASSWIQKVWRAHEKIVPGVSIESMVPYSLESRLNSIQELAKNPEPFIPPSASLPPISFQIFVHSLLEANSVSSSPIEIAQRLIVVPSPSPLSVKSMRQRLSVPAALIDKNGLKSMEFFEIRVAGVSEFQDAFKRHEQSVIPFK
jgi:hypothetical protein